ncbi:MAG: hypothetical protein ACJ757_02160 [Gaiellaceae bacterium]
MAVARRDAVCLTCTSTKRLELNEPAGRRNDMTVQNWLCRSCHQTFTASQRWFGFPLSRERPHTPSDALWSLLFGVPLLFAQALRGICECNEELAQTCEQIARSGGHVLDVLAPDTHSPSRGPDPIGNDLYADFVKRGFGDGTPQMRVIGEQSQELGGRQIEATVAVMFDLCGALGVAVPEIAGYLTELRSLLTPELAARLAELPPDSCAEFDALARRCLDAVRPAVQAVLDARSQADLSDLIPRFSEIDRLGEYALRVLRSLSADAPLPVLELQAREVGQ